MVPGLFGLLLIGAVIYFFIRRADRITTLGDTRSELTIDQKYNLDRRDRQETVDRLLDKIATKGYNALSEREKELLKEHSSSLS